MNIFDLCFPTFEELQKMFLNKRQENKAIVEGLDLSTKEGIQKIRKDIDSLDDGVINLLFNGQSTQFKELLNNLVDVIEKNNAKQEDQEIEIPIEDGTENVVKSNYDNDDNDDKDYDDDVKAYNTYIINIVDNFIYNTIDDSFLQDDNNNDVILRAKDTLIRYTKWLCDNVNESEARHCDNYVEHLPVQFINNTATDEVYNAYWNSTNNNVKSAQAMLTKYTHWLCDNIDTKTGELKK